MPKYVDENFDKVLLTEDVLTSSLNHSVFLRHCHHARVAVFAKEVEISETFLHQRSVFFKLIRRIHKIYILASTMIRKMPQNSRKITQYRLAVQQEQRFPYYAVINFGNFED